MADIECGVGEDACPGGAWRFRSGARATRCRNKIFGIAVGVDPLQSRPIHQPTHSRSDDRNTRDTRSDTHNHM